MRGLGGCLPSYYDFRCFWKDLRAANPVLVNYFAPAGGLWGKSVIFSDIWKVIVLISVDFVYIENILLYPREGELLYPHLGCALNSFATRLLAQALQIT